MYRVTFTHKDEDNVVTMSGITKILLEEDELTLFYCDDQKTFVIDGPRFFTATIVDDMGAEK